jgi:hypothetical protein
VKVLFATSAKEQDRALYLRRYVRKLGLTTNMRVHFQGDVSAICVAQQLLTLVDGKVSADPTSGLISIPNNFCNIVESIQVLKIGVFPYIRHHFDDHK